jgi:probable F420-dependent oxidoreductase
MLDIGRTGIWSGELRRHPDHGELAEAAAELEQLGYSALWFPGGQGGDVFGAARRLLDATQHVPVATGILNVWMHDPVDVAADRAAVEAEYPGRFLLGIGIGHPERVNVDNPGRYRKPLTTMREYVDALDAADPPVPRDALMLAALRRRMLELARDRSAGAHPYFVPVEHTRVAREVLGAGSVLAPEQAVVLETDPERARARAREHTVRYLELPNYTGNLELLGFTPDDFRDGGSDRLVDAVVAWGDEDAIAARVAAHHEAGADHVCIQVVGVPSGQLPRDEWRRLAPALIRD